MTDSLTPNPGSRRKLATERLIKPRPRAKASEAVSSGASPESGIANLPAEAPRFQFFLIDSGWDGPVPNLIRSNLRMITSLQHQDPFFILNHTQSTELLKKHPHLIGKDPILIARDLYAQRSGDAGDYHGFHLNMGLIRDPRKALEVLQRFLNFLAVQRKSGNIEKEIRKQLHQDGLEGALEVLRIGSEGIVGG